MATIESDKADEALTTKMGCEVDKSSRDHNFYWVKEGDKVLSYTKISKGPKHTLRDTLVSMIGKQLKLGGGGNFSKFVACTLSKDEAIQIIKSQA